MRHLVSYFKYSLKRMCLDKFIAEGDPLILKFGNVFGKR